LEPLRSVFFLEEPLSSLWLSSVSVSLTHMSDQTLASLPLHCWRDSPFTAPSCCLLPTAFLVFSFLVRAGKGTFRVWNPGPSPPPLVYTLNFFFDFSFFFFLHTSHQFAFSSGHAGGACFSKPRHRDAMSNRSFQVERTCLLLLTAPCTFGDVPSSS